MQDLKFRELASSAGIAPSALESVSRPIQIIVPYTTPDLSRVALNSAATLAKGIRAEVVLLAVHVVPFPLPLDRPDVQGKHLMHLLESVAVGSSLPVRVELVLARDRTTALHRFLKPGPQVLLVTRKRWWRTAEEKLAGVLAQEGCNVSLIAA